VGLRVGFLIDRWVPSRGGAERALARFAEHLVERGDEVRVFALTAAPDAPGRFERVRARGFRRVTRERALAAALVDAAADCDVTIALRHVARCDLYWPHGGSHLASLRARARARAWARGGTADEPLEPTGRHRLFVDLEREVLARGARRIVCVSELVRRELARLEPSAVDRMVTIQSGLDLERFHARERARLGLELRATLGMPLDEPLITFVARDPELKGLGLLSAALDGLLDRRWRLFVGGSKPARWRPLVRGATFRRTAAAADVHPVAVASAGDLCALPTWRDTSGLALLEALACGTPVVTTTAAGASERLTDDSGTRVEPGDVVALRRAIAHWLDRVDAGAIDRDAIQDCVRDHDERDVLARLTAEVDALAKPA